MRTPAGKDCRYYYADYNRGRNLQQCRLVTVTPGASLPWRPKDCGRCPVPEIMAANSSPDLELDLQIKPVLLGLGRRNIVTAHCRRHNIPVPDPYVGCPECNRERPGLEQFLNALEQDQDR